MKKAKIKIKKKHNALYYGICSNCGKIIASASAPAFLPDYGHFICTSEKIKNNEKTI